MKHVRSRKHTAKTTRKAIRKQLNYLKRDLAAIDGKLAQGKTLNDCQTERLETIRCIYTQQKYVYDNHTQKVKDRIVSVSHPFVRPIVRGKAGKPVEFGMKLDISVTDGWTRLEYHSFDPYNEAIKLQKMIENFYNREGHTPVEYWPTRFTETGKISNTARNVGSDCPVQHWEGRRGMSSAIRSRITRMNVSGWRWNANSAWVRENVVWV